MSNRSRRSSNQVYVIGVVENEDNEHSGYDIFISKLTTANFTGLLGIAVIVCASLLTLAFTCWPQHDAITYPEYWFEPIFMYNIIMAPCISAIVILRARIQLNAQKVLTFKSFLFYYFVRVAGSVTIFISIHYYWVVHLRRPHPMPRTMLLHNLLMSFLVAPLGNWLVFPTDMKTKGNPFRKKILAFTALSWLRVLMGVGYAIILQPIVRHKDYQLSLGIILPLLKKFNQWYNSKFTLWAFDWDLEAAAIENTIAVGCAHSFSLTVVLGSSQINSLNAYILVLADTLMNGWTVRHTIRLHHQGTDAANQQRNTFLKTLAMKEFIEILVPIVYCLVFTGSYLGPNYEIMGGIGVNRWHLQKVFNLYEKLQTIVIFTTLEFLRGAGFAFMLWKLYRLDLYSSYCYVMRNYGWYILVVATFENQIVNGYYLLVGNF